MYVYTAVAALGEPPYLCRLLHRGSAIQLEDSEQHGVVSTAVAVQDTACATAVGLRRYDKGQVMQLLIAVLTTAAAVYVPTLSVLLLLSVALFCAKHFVLNIQNATCQMQAGSAGL